MTPTFAFKILKKEKTLGEKLLHYRKRQKLNLDQVEQITNIRTKYLESLERDEFDRLSSNVYVLGYLKRYAKLLNLDPEQLITQYKKEWEIFKNVQKKNNLFTPETKSTFKPPKIFITPKFLTFAFSFLLLFTLLGYIFYQIKGFIAAPSLELNVSQDNIVIDKNKISLEGKTDNGANLFINNELVSTEPTGEFSKTIRLAYGLNTIEIVAKNKINKETKKTIQVLAKY